MADSSAAEYKFLFISALAVLLLGFKTVDSVLETPLTAPVASLAIDTGITDKAAKNPPRGPAAIVPASRLPDHHLNFHCQKEGKKSWSTDGSFFQIRGQGCAKVTADKIFVVNRSNGYTASIFPLGGSEFQTDLIQLKNGDNHILIQYQNASGKKIEQQLLIKSNQL